MDKTTAQALLIMFLIIFIILKPWRKDDAEDI